jgi:hypothetical protein
VSKRDGNTVRGADKFITDDLDKEDKKKKITTASKSRRNKGSRTEENKKKVKTTQA